MHRHLIELVSARLGSTTTTISPSFDGNLIIVQMRGKHGPTDRSEGEPSYQELDGGCFGHQRIGTQLLVRRNIGAKEANPWRRITIGLERSEQQSRRRMVVHAASGLEFNGEIG